MDWSNLKADYERLGTYAAVAAEYGVSKAYVAQQAKKQGIAPGQPRALPIDWSDLSALYESGLTYAQLTEHYGCSVHAIQNAMARLGVTPRPTGTPEGYAWTDDRRAAHRAAIDRPEWRAKNRENLLKRLPTMRGPSANSPLEKLLHLALIKAGISFRTQEVKIGRYCVDIELLQAPVIIEADGALHVLRKEQDAQRDADLTAAGYRVFRFTGSRINCDPDGCVREVVDACGITPDAEPVSDIRNGMVGYNNPNWGGGSRTFLCDHCGTEFTEPGRNARGGVKKFCKSECYGKWMTEHPEASNRRLRIDWTGLGDLYSSGARVADLAARYSCSANTVRRELARQGVALRRVKRG